MVDPLNAWWSQQLVLCGWAFEPDPTSVEPVEAVERLSRLGIAERGELGWRLLEAFPPGLPDPQQQLAAFELLALAVAADWLPPTRARAWMLRLASTLQARYASLDEWLSALREARLEQGWVQGDEAFALASEALARLEHEECGITWGLLGDYLARCEAEPLWPEQETMRPWLPRALFSPLLVESPDHLRDWPDAAAWLGEAWQVHGRDDLIRVLLWLASQGHRYGWDLDVARLLEQDPPARQAWVTGLGDQRRYGEIVLEFIERGEPLEWAAWDWLRLIDLAYAGLALGWLEEIEAEHFATHACDLLTRRYSDWVALVQAYQRGRSLFEGRRHAGEPLAGELALLLYSPVTPWQAPLQELIGDAQRESSRIAIRAWRRDARHWVLALASVREPELLYRQGIPAEIPAARRRDAQRYLSETLGLFPDEGAAGLARYWLPAQSHHLNQLAADAAHNTLPPLVTAFGQPTAEAIRSREALKTCVRHAATIHMAEKYAFYLLMAGDGGDFDATALAGLAQALKSVLCHLYADSRRLLDAWAAWEAVLPEVPDDTLVHEIRWHRDDPGSCFHWLDWQQTAWQEPGPKPTLSRFTALSLTGPLNPGIWGEPQREGVFESEAAREWLDSHYGLHNAQELRDFLDFLLDAGDRQEYQINYAPYTLNRTRLEEEIAIFESGECAEEERHHLLRLRRVRDNDNRCNEVDMAAWDLAQTVDLAIAGRNLGWLDEPAFDDVLDRAVREAQRHYASWHGYAEGLYAGFAFFMGETSERETFLSDFREGLVAWLTGAPPLAGPWASLDYPGARPRHWAPLHIDTLTGDSKTLH
ncbi:Protein of unknown function [Modicisalibacter ilicicola DSM 19980]|uniref:DUF1266 domain-containing protein n=1 Tax=Modicisalibacter ilicicola DSM 19980 TaxID=1121942 RepID=A0A1M4Y8L0_9GAMM|nr:DUF1266 domain-containing protein [Halomonas ilicicola]SHF01792.1 Protein of unknown function [Halomonas ilicicola DSM 19980]